MIRRVAAAVPAILPAGCGIGAGAGVEASVLDTKKAMAQIRAQVEGQRQCAPLLSGSAPIELSAHALAGPRVDALVAAGLVTRVPVANPADDRPRVRIEPTTAGSRDIWLRRLDPASPAEPLLCYGGKHVTAVHAERRNVGAETGPAAEGAVLRYDYTIIQSPAWTARADVRAAFPFLPRELGGIDIHRSQIMAAARWTKPVKWTVRRS